MDIQTILGELGPWAWWILGLILLVLEVALPGAVIIWFGLAAFMVGAISFFVDWTWQYQLLAFGLLSMGSLIVGRRYLRAQGDPADSPNLNKRAQRYVGNTYALPDPIENGKGRVKIEDTYWRITGPDLPKGTRVTVVAADGAKLQVAEAKQE